MGHRAELAGMAGDPEVGMSVYLADACALIDFYTSDEGFPARLLDLFERDSADIGILATTVWEIAIKISLKKLTDLRDTPGLTLENMFRRDGFAMLAFDHATAEQAAGLPLLHRDPFDRALVAAAQRTGRTVLTYDGAIARYGVPVLW